MTIAAHLRSLLLSLPYVAFVLALFFLPGLYWRVEVFLAPLLPLAVGHPALSLFLVLLFTGICTYADGMLNMYGWRQRPWTAALLALTLLLAACTLFAFYATIAILPLAPVNLPYTLLVFTGGLAMLYLWARWRLD